MDKHFIVFIPEEGVYGEVISLGSYASMVEYSVSGINYKVMMLNEDLDFIYPIEAGEEE